MVTTEEKKKIGKKSRADGQKFEGKVRDDLISKGWVVIKNPNNVIKFDTPNGQTVEFKQGKPKYNPITKQIMMRSNGFPDYICYCHIQNHILHKIGGKTETKKLYEVIGVEAKSNGYLGKEEKEKCSWLLNKGIFSEILIASKLKDNPKEIIYKEFDIGNTKQSVSKKE